LVDGRRFTVGSGAQGNDPGTRLHPMKDAVNWCSTHRCAGTLPAPERTAKMSSKLTLSIAVALALSAVGGVARANPMPTSTDEARALNGQYTSQLSIDHNPQANAEVTSTDDARAVAGNTVPAPISPSVQSMIA